MDHFWYFWVVVVIQNLIVRLPINQTADWGWLSWAGGLQTVKLGNCNHPVLPATTHPIYYNLQQGKCVSFCTFMIGSIVKLFDLEKLLHGGLKYLEYCILIEFPIWDHSTFSLMHWCEQDWGQVFIIISMTRSNV